MGTLRQRKAPSRFLRSLRVHDRQTRDELRFRVERRFGGLISREYSRLFVDRYLRPRTFLRQSDRHPTWLGIPIWKVPLDAWILQEIIFETRPDVLIETGTQFGGGTIFFASIFDLLGAGRVISVDINHSGVDRRVGAHPRVTLIEGTSTSSRVLDELQGTSRDQRVMVVLDSDHGFETVSCELDYLSALVSPGCYLVVEDTALGDLYLPGKGSAAAALDAWLPNHPEFSRDRSRDRFGSGTNPGGWLRREADAPRLH